ncbi:class I SAM-dependent methyltransferase [Vineibacter terrae]|nr:class I SAM-dependent methyltransferase [Vineibacter terrae]
MSAFRRHIKRWLGPRLSNARFLFGAPLAYKPGHFYSPICDPKDLARHYRDPDGMAGRVDLPGIDLREPEQRALWEDWKPYLLEFPFAAQPKNGLRFHYANSSFGPGDATVLYCMLRHFKPRRLIEVGSGFSSVCALDTIDRYLGDVTCTFIDPHPGLLLSLLEPADRSRIRIIGSEIQDVALETFDTLDAGDLLFIDSTHVAKTGSDVVHELFAILPRLKPGVIVHLHDIHYPFEYPKAWVVDLNYSWNEVYAIRAFLSYNSAFEVLFFNDYFGRFHGDLLDREAPDMALNYGSGLWLRRRA